MVAGRHALLRLRPHRLVEPLPLARRRGRAALPDGGRVRPAAVGLRHVAPTASQSSDTHRLHATPRRRQLAPRQPGHRDRAAQRHRDAVHDDFAACASPPASACSIAGSPTETSCRRRARLDYARTSRCLRAVARVGRRHRLSLDPEAIEFPTEDGQTAHAFTTRRGTATSLRPTSEKPAAAGHQPRRPDRATSASLKPRASSTGPAAGSPCSTSTTAAAPATAATTASGSTAWGVVDVDDCVERRALSGRARRGRPQPAGDPRRQRRRLHDAVLPDLPRRLQGRREPLRHQRPRALAHDTHKFESRYLDRLIGPYPERARPLRERSPIHFTRPLLLPGDLLPRARRQGRAAEPGRDDGRSRCAPRGCRSPTSPSPASSTVSARPKTSSARSKPSCTSTRKSLASNRPIRSSL